MLSLEIFNLYVGVVCWMVIVNEECLCLIDFVRLDMGSYVDFDNCYDDPLWCPPELERFVDVVVTFVGDCLLVS